MKEKALFFFAICIVLLQVFVYLPSSIWIQNQFNFDSSYSDSLTLLMLLASAILAISFVIVIIIPKFIQKYLLPFFVVLSILFFIQQNILVWEYGILDGKNLEFSAKASLGYIDTTVWIIAFLILIFKRPFLTKHTNTILVFSAIVSTSIFLMSLYSYDFDRSKNSASFTEDKKFEFSKDKNIIVFVLDGFQSDLFWQIIDSEPKITNNLDGFKFYPNTTAVFAKTYPSIPLLLTGKVYQKQQPIRDFLDSAYRNSILSELIDSNWDVGLYPFLKNMIPINASFMSNYREKTTKLNKVKSYLQALDLSIFRSVPHIVKTKIYNKGDFIIEKYILEYIDIKGLFVEEKNKIKKLPRVNKHRGINFLENLKTFGSIQSSQPTFKFYHLLMPHAPFSLNKNLEYGKYNNGFDSYQNYTYASLKLMVSYLNELKKIGIYDNSAIIIVADHGGGDYNLNKYDFKSGQFQKIEVEGREKASAKPLLLIKGFKAQNPFEIDMDKPVSLMDVAPTITSFSGMENKDTKGLIIDEIDDKQPRERLFYYYKFTGWDTKYLQDFNVFKINGNIYNPKAWSKKGLLTAQDTSLSISSKYELNKTITYGTDLKNDSDYQNQFIVGENYKLKPSSVYSTSQKINLSIPLNEPLIVNELYKFKIKASTRNNNPEIFVGFNNEIFKHLKTETLKDIQYIYLQSIKSIPSNTIHIKLAPGNLLNNNQVLISRVNITTINLAQIRNSSVINFSEALENFQLAGFLEKRKWGRWSSKKQSSMLFRGVAGFCHKGYIQLNLRKFYANVDSEKFKIFFNGKQLKKIKQQKQKYFFQCPTNYIEHNKIINLAFETETVISPIQAKKGKSQRTLGFGLKSIQFGKLDKLLSDKES